MCIGVCCCCCVCVRTYVRACVHRACVFIGAYVSVCMHVCMCVHMFM